MPTYSIAEAKNNLSRLIDEANAGEAVTITRHGKRIATIQPAESEPKVLTPQDLAEIAAERGSLPANALDWVEEIRRMRDEER